MVCVHMSHVQVCVGGVGGCTGGVGGGRHGGVVVVTPEAAPGEVCGEAADRRRRAKSEETGGLHVGSPTMKEERGRWDGLHS